MSCQMSLRIKWNAPRICAINFLFALVVDSVTEFAREGALSGLLYADI